MNSREFGDKYLTREEKEEALKQMTDEEIEELIRTQEIFYAKYLKAYTGAGYREYEMEQGRSHLLRLQ